MDCPNCKIPFVEEKAEKYFCVTCGWFEKVGKEWQRCEAPEPEPERTPEPEPEPLQKTAAQIQTVVNVPQPEPSPAALEPDPATLEPDPATLEPDPAALGTRAPVPEPARSVKKILGGLVTITEVDE